MRLHPLLLAGILLAPPVRATAQISTSPTPPSSPAASTPPITFEVTSVKPSKAGTTSSHSSMDNGRFTASNVTLKNLMAYTAFNVPEPRILGGPKWLGTARFDIEAKLDATTLDRWNHLDRHQHGLAGQALFQHLLADRFHLRYHWETRTLPIYALVPAKTGPRLHPSTQTDADTDTNDGNITAKGITLVDLARTLTQELSSDLGRVVIDQTNLPGRFDLTLTWTPDTGNGAPPTDTGPSLFTAIQEQLGLKLTPTRGPVQILLIDQLDLPTPD